MQTPKRTSEFAGTASRSACTAARQRSSWSLLTGDRFDIARLDRDVQKSMQTLVESREMLFLDPRWRARPHLFRMLWQTRIEKSISKEMQRQPVTPSTMPTPLLDNCTVNKGTKRTASPSRSETSRPESPTLDDALLLASLKRARPC